MSEIEICGACGEHPADCPDGLCARCIVQLELLIQGYFDDTEVVSVRPGEKPREIATRHLPEEG